MSTLTDEKNVWQGSDLISKTEDILLFDFKVVVFKDWS